MEDHHKLYNDMVLLCEEGNLYFNDEKFEDAIAKYIEALELVPEPITDWETSTWILTSIADSFFLMEDYKSALQPLIDVMHCPGAIGNPFIHLRFGQVQFELGNLDRAKDELARAYMAEGDDIFKNDDEKYLAFVRNALAIESK